MFLRGSYPPSEATIGKQAPTFSAPAVVDGEIANVSLEQYRGKWVVLLFYPVSAVLWLGLCVVTGKWS